MATDVIIPAKDEGENIKDVLLMLQNFKHSISTVFVVVDSEFDPTLDAIRNLGEDLKLRVQTMVNDQSGYLAALKLGFGQSFANPNSDSILVAMADQKDPLKTLRTVFDLADKKIFDLVCPSRHCGEGHYIGGSIIKKYLSRIAGQSLRFLIHLQTLDPTNNFKLYRKEIISKIQIESKFGFEVAFELTLKAHFLGAKIIDIPTTWRERSSGVSQFNLIQQIPYYLKWYFWSLKKQFSKSRN